jgi:hypothetical protein
MIRKLTMTLALVLGLAFSTAAFADHHEGKEADKDPKKHIEMHKKMAEAHEKAADCLKDGKPEAECYDAFKKAKKEAGCDCCGAKECDLKKGKGKGKNKKDCKHCHDKDKKE